MKHIRQNEKRCQEKFWVPSPEQKEKGKGIREKAVAPLRIRMPGEC
jgi:hypothetical protein